MITAFVLGILGIYLGFWLGRRYEWGAEEERAEVESERSARGGVRLNSVRIRR
jgi:hypothetical protein